MTTHTTREAWLKAAADLAAPLVSGAAGIPAPTFHVSVGFPKGARGKGRAIGQCWDGTSSADGSCHVFICPTLVDPITVLSTLIHEQIHATVGCKEKHRGAFPKAAKKAGLVKPWTATTPSPELAETLKQWLEGLGAYPHAALALPIRGTKGSRLRLWECGCEKPIKVRVASDDFDATCNVCEQPFEKEEK